MQFSFASVQTQDANHPGQVQYPVHCRGAACECVTKYNRRVIRFDFGADQLQNLMRGIRVKITRRSSASTSLGR